MARLFMYDDGGLFFQARGNLSALAHEAWKLIRYDHPALILEPESVEELSAAAEKAGVFIEVHRERGRISDVLRRCLSARVAH